jgi:hypothetical protein
MGKEQKNRASPLAGFNNSFCKLPLSFQVEKRRFFSMDRKIFHPAWGLAHDFAREGVSALLQMYVGQNRVAVPMMNRPTTWYYIIVH